MGRIDLPDPVRDEDVFFDGPDEHDCVTAAHLRDCGFCRAVILDPRVERMWATMQNMMDSPFMEGSEPRRIFYALPKQERAPQKPVPRRWWERLLGW